MKTKSLILAVCLVSLPALAQLSYVDIVTRTTNATSGSGSFITVFGQFTNASYAISNPASITIGDPMPSAFVKVNTNFWWQYNFILAVSNRWAATNVDIYGKLSAQQSWVNWSSNSVAVLSNQTLAVGMDLTNKTDQLGSDLTNFTLTVSQDLTNKVDQLGQDLTNQTYQVGQDLTNRLDAISANGSSGSETVFKILSPNGTTWYLHVDDSGTLTVTGSQ